MTKRTRQDGTALDRRWPGEVLSRARERVALERAGVVGGLDVTTVDLAWPEEAPPDPGQVKSPLGWRLTVSQLLLVAHGQGATVMKKPALARGAYRLQDKGIASPPELQLVVQPERRQVMNAVAWAFRYPVALLRGPEQRILEILEARAPYRMHATFGILHGGSRKTPRKPTPPSSPPEASPAPPPSRPPVVLPELDDDHDL